MSHLHRYYFEKIYSVGYREIRYSPPSRDLTATANNTVILQTFSRLKKKGVQSSESNQAGISS